MNDNNIIKALECCVYGQAVCKNCHYNYSDDCQRTMMIDVLDLNNRQKAEIERLQHILLNFMNEAEEWERKYGVDIENIPQIAILSTIEKSVIERIKSKATQEIAKTIHTEIENAIENNYAVKRNYQDKQHIINDEFVMYVDGKIHALSGIDDFIDKGLKEMVGDTE